MKIKLLSVIIPCYNEEGNINKLIHELTIVLKPYSFSYEIICIDDGSKDATFKIIQEIAKANERISGFSLSRNFGHQIALLAGLENSRGDVVITMDGDLQHPTEVIPELIKKHMEGFDIVNTKREYDQSATFFKKLTSKWFYILINKISDIKVEPQSSDFRLMNRETVNAFLKLEEHDRFTRGLVQWLGFKQTTVSYKANPRYAGTTGYSLKKMISFAIDGITSMSSKPLRLSLYSGIVFFLIGFLYGVFALINYMNGITVPGWTSILITILVIGGVQLLMLSIIGEYVAKIFNEAKSRPLYFIKSSTKDT